MWYVGVVEIENEPIVINTDDASLLDVWKQNNVYIFKDNVVNEIFGDKAKYASSVNTIVEKVDDEYKIIKFSYQEKSIAELKKQKLAELTSTKTSVEFSDILYKDKLYQADNKAQELLTKSLVIFSAMGQTPPEFVWKSSDNSLNPFSLEDLKNLSLLIASRTQKITLIYWKLKAQIKEAKTKDELMLINIAGAFND